MYLVLVTSNGRTNMRYAYPLSDEMIAGHEFAKPSFVKCQVISGYTQRDIIRKFGSVKQPYFDEIVDKIIESIF